MPVHDRSGAPRGDDQSARSGDDESTFPEDDGGHPTGAGPTSVWVVCDLEATCWRAADDPELSADQRAQAEIIEIGALKIAAETFETTDEFSEFVRPVHHPILSDFCRELTHIEQEDVSSAAPFEPVWARLCAWIGAPLEAVTFASWGAYDHAQLKRQTRAAGLPLPAWRHFNIKQAFAEWRRLHTGERTALGLGAALDHLGWAFEGTPHRALADARNTARLLAHIQSPRNLGEPAWRVMTALAEAHRPVALERLRRLHPGLRLSLGRTRRALLNADLVRAPEAGHLALTPAGHRALAALAGAHAAPDATRETPPSTEPSPIRRRPAEEPPWAPRSSAVFACATTPGATPPCLAPPSCRAT